jgi:DNA-binding Lrp family transcriptional regulator
MAALDDRLLNEFQRDFPLTSRPYAEIAARLGTDEGAVLATLGELVAGGKVSRIGATFVPGRIGAATLAALSVPQGGLQQVAELVSSFPEVNHNYEREHHFNLWFVITGPDESQIDAVVRDIERAARCGRVLSLPMVEPYHLDLGFDLDRAGSETAPAREEGARRKAQGRNGNLHSSFFILHPSGHALVSALQEGLPLTSAPYAELALRAGTTEAAVIATLKRWLDARVINRLGVIVRHHELGYHANAMVVWDVPNADVRAVGRRVAAAPFVTLCYRRLRHLPDWRYNLYCMIHGKDRNQVLAQIAELRANCNLVRYPFEILFSRQRFKQRGARYLPAVEPAVAHG